VTANNLHHKGDVMALSDKAEKLDKLFTALSARKRERAEKERELRGIEEEISRVSVMISQLREELNYEINLLNQQ
jgi:hypothetical protein